MSLGKFITLDLVTDACCSPGDPYLLNFRDYTDTLYAPKTRWITVGLANTFDVVITLCKNLSEGVKGLGSFDTVLEFKAT